MNTSDWFVSISVGLLNTGLSPLVLEFVEKLLAHRWVLVNLLCILCSFSIVTWKGNFVSLKYLAIRQTLSVVEVLPLLSSIL